MRMPEETVQSSRLGEVPYLERTPYEQFETISEGRAKIGLQANSYDKGILNFIAAKALSSNMVARGVIESTSLAGNAAENENSERIMDHYPYTRTDCGQAGFANFSIDTTRSFYFMECYQKHRVKA
jgi:Cdc6-like AAA superfamily ATPase